uniref:Uncharacterized protein n=1 Tax=Dulem virus 42 TaxID=3145760 RepID=A0AAU8B7C9_9CAUD
MSLGVRHLLSLENFKHTMIYIIVFLTKRISKR